MVSAATIDELAATPWDDLDQRWRCFFLATFAAIGSGARHNALGGEFFELLLEGLRIRSRIADERARCLTTESGYQLEPWAKSSYARRKLYAHIAWWLEYAPLLVAYCEEHHADTADECKGLVLRAWREWTSEVPKRLAEKWHADADKHRKARTQDRPATGDPDASLRRADAGGAGAAAVRADAGRAGSAGQTTTRREAPRATALETVEPAWM